MDAGSSLLRNPNKLSQITEHVVNAVPEIPVTVKIRIGWDEENINALEIGKIVEDVGAKALTIHGRTKVQGYRGDANWDIIAKVAESIKIPVIGNGSIQSAKDVIRVKNETQCAGVMIGRAALGYPWIFRDIKYYLKEGTLPSHQVLMRDGKQSSNIQKLSCLELITWKRDVTISNGCVRKSLL